MYDQFISQGFTDILDINFNEELENLQNLIYLNTKHLLVEHDENLPIEEKINQSSSSNHKLSYISIFTQNKFLLS